MRHTPEKKKRPHKESLVAPGPFQVKTILNGGDGIPERPKRPPEDILFGPDPAPASVKLRRDSTQSVAGPRSAADILFGDSEPKLGTRPGIGIATKDKIKNGSHLGQRDKREETDTNIWGVKRRRVSTISSESPQVAEALVEGLVGRSTLTEPSFADDLGTASRVLVTPPPQDVAEVEQDIMEIREIAERRGFPFPVRLLDHFLAGKGTPLEIPREVALGLGPVADAQAINQERFRSSFLGEGGPNTKLIEQKLLALRDGGKPTEFDDNWDKAIEAFGEVFLGEWSTAFGLGDVQLSSNGNFKARRSGNTITITGRLTHRFEDDYNFEKDKFPANLTNRGWILQEKGTAKVYKLWGEWAQDVVVTIEVVNGELQEPRFKWIDEPAHRP